MVKTIYLLHVLTSTAFGTLDLKASIEARIVTGTAPHLEQLLASSESAQSSYKQTIHWRHLLFAVTLLSDHLFHRVMAVGGDFHSSTLQSLLIHETTFLLRPEHEKKVTEGSYVCEDKMLINACDKNECEFMCLSHICAQAT